MGANPLGEPRSAGKRLTKFSRHGVSSFAPRSERSLGSRLRPAVAAPTPDLLPSLIPSPGKSNRNETPIHVLKFGGTSMGSESSIRNVVSIISDSARKSALVVVVSAMSGVTDRLVDAIRAAENRESATVTDVFRDLRAKHSAVADALINSDTLRIRFISEMISRFAICEQLCCEAMLTGRMSPVARDYVLGSGECQAAPLLAVVLLESGVPAEAIEATRLVVTDSNHGAARPIMGDTRQACREHLLPLVSDKVVPVVTGFVGATSQGAPTTLGRGGSDYSATIIGAAVGADEVTIWTDVDGMMTADPRIVPGASVIPEISYADAARLAFFGAKVLHSKTLEALGASGVPVSIRNTFAPASSGTRITKSGPSVPRGVTAIAATTSVALFRLGALPGLDLSSLSRRASAALSRASADLLMMSSLESKNQALIVVSEATAKAASAELSCEFIHDLAGMPHRIASEPVGLITLVGSSLAGTAHHLKGKLGAPGAAAIAHSLSPDGSTFTIVVRKEDIEKSVAAIHEETRFWRTAS
jgi:aspartokinase/homoserine dehydrogenase 1